MMSLGYGWSLGEVVRVNESLWRVTSFNHRHAKGVIVHGGTKNLALARLHAETKLAIKKYADCVLQLHLIDDMQPKKNVTRL
jgi:hypothetical protein